MSESNGFFDKYFRVVLLILFGIPAVLLAVMNLGVVANILMVLLGFGMVILVHEFGHFVVAKASGIKVEAFSLFMPPILFGVQRTAEGIRFRILPEIVTKNKKEKKKEFMILMLLLVIVGVTSSVSAELISINGVKENYNFGEEIDLAIDIVRTRQSFEM